MVVAAAGLALFGWDYASIFCYAGLGLLFYLGFSRLKSTLVRRAVGGLGVLLLVVIGVTILAWWFLPMRYLNGPVEIARLVVAAASILAAGHVPS